MDKLIRRILLVATLLASCIAHAHSAAVQIVIPSDNTAIRNLARAARHALLEIDPGLQISIAPSTEIHRLDDSKLLIPIGDELMEKMPINASAEQPILFFYVSSIAYQRLPRRTNQTALFRDQPLARQLHLSALLLPSAHRALVIYRRGQFDTRQIHVPSPLAVSYRAVDTDGDWIRNMAQWVQQNDVVIGVDDRVLYNRDSIRSILLTTYRQNKVLIGPDRGFVNAGSLASTYSSPEQYLRQLQRMVRAWLHSHTLPPAQYPRDFLLAVNRQVADSLGLRLPEDEILLQQLRHSLQTSGAQ
jgi:ABC-type uncharacterized transport system substrate-binding protein